MRFSRSITISMICCLMFGCSGTLDNAERRDLLIEKRISITSYNSPFTIISNDKADSNFSEFSNILETDDGPANNNDGDVPCTIKFSRDGNVSTFSQAQGTNIIDNEDDFNRVCNLPGFIHIVGQINYCAEVFKPGGYIGCSDLSGRCMIVTRPAGTFTADQESILWAHEYGHTRGLGHPCQFSCNSLQEDRIMHPQVAIKRKKIGLSECEAYKR